MTQEPEIVLIACDVFQSELSRFAAGSPRIIRQTLLEIGLHDHPEVLRARLQSEIDACDPLDSIAGIVLLYGLCGLGTAGLKAGRHRLVIPRAHDCITVFLGSRQAFNARQGERCYYYTPGWNRARRVPGPDREARIREEYAERFDDDALEALFEMERETWDHYEKATFIDLGTADAEVEANYAASCAAWLGWKLERIRGDETLMCDALAGRWDPERFLVVEPGQKILHSADENIFKIGPA